MEFPKDELFVSISPFYSRCLICYCQIERSYEDKHINWHDNLGDPIFDEYKMSKE